MFPLPIDVFPLSFDMYNGDSTIPTILNSFFVNIGFSSSSLSSFSSTIVLPIKSFGFCTPTYP